MQTLQNLRTCKMGVQTFFLLFIFAPVKLFTIIMSFWLLFLSCLPCGDSIECNSKGQVSISATSDHQQHKHQGEHCTPFCTCSCCAASVFFQTIASYKISKRIFPSTKYLVYDISYSSQISFTIWQPPNLS